MNSNWWEKNGELVITVVIMAASAVAGCVLGRAIYGRGVRVGATRSVEVLERVGVFDNIDRDALGAKIKKELNI